MRKLIRPAATLAVAGGLSLTGLWAPGQAAIGQPLPVASAGALVGWGAGPGSIVTGSLNGVGVVDADASELGWGAAVKPDGTVVSWGSGAPSTADLTDVAAIDVYSGGLVALRKDGSVAGASDPTTGLDQNVPAVTDATDVAVNMGAAALAAGGTVQEWGAYASAMPVPSTLDGVTTVAGGVLDFSAVKSDGTVVNWGMGGAVTTPVPEDVQTHVAAIAGGSVAGVLGSTYAAVLQDGSVQAWDADGEITTPPALDGKKVVDVDVNGSIVALTADGQIFSWGTDVAHQLGNFSAGSATGVPTAVAAGMNADGSTFGYAIVTPFRAVDAPSIAGTAEVGQTLTETPATFSVTPDHLTTQWLADGAAIAGATGDTLSLTAAQAGKRISVRQVAARAGQDDVTTVSTATAPVAAAATPPPATASSTTTVKVHVKKHGKAVVKVKVATATGASPAGKATVVVKKHAKKVAKKEVKVNAHGVAKLKLKKLAPGKYQVKANYAGSASVAASTDHGRFKVRR